MGQTDDLANANPRKARNPPKPWNPKSRPPTSKTVRSPLTSEQMHVLAFVPGDADARRTLYEMGQADVRAWARAQGWPGA